MTTPRSRNLFNPSSFEPYKLSRSRLENFIRCPRCFYLDRRMGIDTPSIPAYTLNSAVDHLLKKEFDAYRARQQPHALMEKYGIDAIPYSHPQLEEWRNNFVGIRFHHRPTNFLLFGAVDDLWLHANGELIVVDYKSTSKEGEITLDDRWKDSYKRQMEFYQWLFLQNGFRVSPTGYFVYANARKDPDRFDARLEFQITLLPHAGNLDWIEPSLRAARACLMSDHLPVGHPGCEYCIYRGALRGVE
jgi:RecB family exonuclease